MIPTHAVALLKPFADLVKGQLLVKRLYSIFDLAIAFYLDNLQLVLQEALQAHTDASGMLSHGHALAGCICLGTKDYHLLLEASASQLRRGIAPLYTHRDGKTCVECYRAILAEWTLQLH